MITGAAFCPHPPLLVPALARQSAPELLELRTACRTSLARIGTPGCRFVVVGSGPAWAVHASSARGSLTGFGVELEVSLGSDEPGPLELPLSLTLGAWLLRETFGPNCGAIGYSVGTDGQQFGPNCGAIGYSVGTDGQHGGPRLPAWTSERSDYTLLVMGDASARRTPTGPGYLDERAAEFDAGIVAALRSGAPAQLQDALRDDVLAGELLAAGTSAWRHVAQLLGSASFDAELLYDDAPYGVGYVVAAWTKSHVNA